MEPPPLKRHAGVSAKVVWFFSDDRNIGTNEIDSSFLHADKQTDTMPKIPFTAQMFFQESVDYPKSKSIANKNNNSILNYFHFKFLPIRVAVLLNIPCVHRRHESSRLLSVSFFCVSKVQACVPPYKQYFRHISLPKPWQKTMQPSF